MTVAAGLVCHNGVVLSADTEITFLGGTGKKYEPKIFPINREMGCYLTYAGDPYFAKELVDRLREDTKRKDAEEILETIKREYRDMLEAQRKKENVEERSSAWVLVTLRKDIRQPFKEAIYDYRTSLYLARDDHFLKVDRYAALGIGEEQAAAIFDPLYLPLSTRENAYVAVYAIQKVKRSVQGVGGPTEVIEILNDGSLPFANFGKQEIKQIEKEFDFLEKQLHPLLIAFPSEMTDVNFRGTLKRFCEELKKRRTERLKRRST